MGGRRAGSGRDTPRRAWAPRARLPTRPDPSCRRSGPAPVAGRSFQAPAARGAAGLAEQPGQGAEQARRLGERGGERREGRLLRDFGQIRPGEEAGLAREGLGQAKAAGQQDGRERQQAGGTADHAADPGGKGRGRGVGVALAGDGDHQQFQRAGPGPAAKLAVGGVGAAELGREGAPGVAGQGDPEDRIERAAAVRGRAAAGVGDVGEEEGVFGVREAHGGGVRGRRGKGLEHNRNFGCFARVFGGRAG